MGLRRFQTCERCGTERPLSERENPELGGWRALNSGSLEATFCNVCVRDLVTAALAAAEAREEAIRG